jgi:hypothetical protein
MTVSYERPRIQSLSATQILERMGPVQGYDGRTQPVDVLGSSVTPGSTTGRLGRD